jgi:hypothetical protein
MYVVWLRGLYVILYGVRFTESQVIAFGIQIFPPSTIPFATIECIKRPLPTTPHHLHSFTRVSTAAVTRNLRLHIIFGCYSTPDTLTSDLAMASTASGQTHFRPAQSHMSGVRGAATDFLAFSTCFSPAMCALLLDCCVCGWCRVDHEVIHGPAAAHECVSSVL